MKKKVIFTLFLALAIVLTVATGAQPTKAQNNIVVGLVQIGTDNPFWIAQVEGGQEAARRYGFTLKVTSGQGDVSKQVQAFEDLVNQKVSVISVNMIDVKAYGPALAKAKAAGIPVVCLFSPADGCTTTVGLDETTIGRTVGNYAVQLLIKKNGSAKGNVAILLGLLGQTIDQGRAGGFISVVSQYPDIKVVAKEPTNWDTKKAADITTNWLTAYPDLDLIYGESDSLTVPAGNVLQRAGKKILLTSVDGTDSGLQGVKAGTLQKTIALAPIYNGFWNVYSAYLVAKGLAFPSTYLMPGALVTTDNVDKLVQMNSDMDKNVQKFPFELPLVNIVAGYTGKLQ